MTNDHADHCTCSPQCKARRAAYEKRRLHDALTGRPRRPIDGTGTRRRLQALQLAGWPWQAIADAAGLPRATVVSASARCLTVRRDTADGIRTAYDRLALTPGPSVQVRNRARDRGYAPALAWDDETMDDPAVQPDYGDTSDPRKLRTIDHEVIRRALLGQTVTANRAERLEVARRWQRTGGAIEDLNRRHGWNIGRDLSAGAVAA